MYMICLRLQYGRNADEILVFQVYLPTFSVLESVYNNPIALIVAAFKLEILILYIFLDLYGRLYRFLDINGRS